MLTYHKATKRKTIGLILFALLMILMVACTSPNLATPVQHTIVVELPTATVEPPTTTAERQNRILFIGDSFSFGFHEYLERMASFSDSISIMESKLIAQGGMSLYGHWFTPQTVRTIQNGTWTIVILQEDLAIEGLDVQKFYEYARKFDAEIRNIGAETILYMPWEYDNDNPMRIEQIASAFRDIGTELGIKVAPAGLARKSQKESPGRKWG
jgi:hypothetical protein